MPEHPLDATASNADATPIRPARVRQAEQRRTLSIWVFVGSLLTHAALALQLRAAASERVDRSVSASIDIELAPPPPVIPPPPPPTPEPPPAAPPPELKPVKRQAAPRPQPAAAKTVAQPENPPPQATSDLPASADGELAPGPPTPGPVVPAAPAPPPAPPAPAKPAPVVEAKEGANYLKNPRPRYPRLALKEGWEGKVILRVKVLPNGKVGGATVQQSAGRNALDEAALEIVQSWTFVPATQGGKPIAGWVAVPFEFRIN